MNRNKPDLTKKKKIPAKAGLGKGETTVSVLTKAIKEKCDDCSGFGGHTVKKCDDKSCPLWNFRSGV